MSRKISKKSRVARLPKKRPNRASSPDELTTFSANDLQAMDFPPLEFLVEGLITEGLTLLAGKPKMGKSWMALDIAMSVAIGCDALGDRACKKGTTLYCALEDNPRRLRRRMLHVYGDQSTWPSNFHFTTQMKKLDDGGSEQLEDWILKHRPSLIIIDTLVCVRSASKRRTEYEADYATLAPLQRLAGEYRIAIIIVHHQRKMGSEDPLDTVSGTTGLSGGVDNILILDRKSHGVTLYGRGREMDDIDITVELNDGYWRILGDSDAVKISSQRRAIIDVLKSAERPMGPKEISEALDRPQDSVRQLLTSMAKDGEVKKQTRGKYELP